MRRAGDQRSMSCAGCTVHCALFAVHLCDSFKSLLFLTYERRVERDKGRSRSDKEERRVQQSTKERDTHLMGHCDIYLCKTSDAHTQSSSLNVSFHSFTVCFVLFYCHRHRGCRVATHFRIFFFADAGIICPLINLLITRWNFICNALTQLKLWSFRLGDTIFLCIVFVLISHSIILKFFSFTDSFSPVLFIWCDWSS